MKYTNTLLAKNGSLQLVKTVSERGNKKYLIKYIGREFKQISLSSIFDPVGNRLVGSSSHYTWKFNNRQEAEEAMAIAILRGPDWKI